MMFRRYCCFVLCVFALADDATAESADFVPGGQPLTTEGDIASTMVDGIDRFLMRKTDESVAQRMRYYDQIADGEPQANQQREANRRRLAKILGVETPRRSVTELTLMGTTQQPSLVGQTESYKIFAVSWPVIREIHGEGLLLVPRNRPVVADVVAIPDADQSPEQLVGLLEGIDRESQFARHFAESGYRVIVPVLVNRTLTRRGPSVGKSGVLLSNREYIYRSAFVLGQHIIGYELQKVFAAIDWLEHSAHQDSLTSKPPKASTAPCPIGAFGYGEGGMLALYAGALDERLDVVGVSGHFTSRQTMWQHPIDRNIFGLLERFGDAELAAMISPRRLLVEASRGVAVDLPGEGGAPGRLTPPALESVRSEFARAESLIPGESGHRLIVTSADGNGAFGSRDALREFDRMLVGGSRSVSYSRSPAVHRRIAFDPATRQDRQIEELDRHNQWLLRESPFARREFMKDVDTSSLETFEASIDKYRDIYREEVIGNFRDPILKPNARLRKSWETEHWTGYEVVLDVFPDVIAYGVLLVPKNIPAGERRPVVVCQHGLEGRPTDVFLGDHRAYHDFAAKLCERGFVTFAPQNLYLFEDRFRVLQRKANPLGKTLFSIIVPQHQQIVNWLQSLPIVDPARIAFYGLSYGGKSAMRIPALVTDYCLSICSADFNEWVRKNASTQHRFSYVWTKEYEIFEFNLGGTFNYAEMAALICPRPFMVERGHFDGVGDNEWVAYEYAKVRNLYQAKLGIADRTEIEWFVGPHTINGKGTFEFLHRHLKWPRPN